MSLRPAGSNPLATGRLLRGVYTERSERARNDMEKK
jgi:hypothetical protein